MAENDAFTEVPLEHEGITFTMQVRHEPSGLATSVFHGPEKVASVRMYHSEDQAHLTSLVLRDRAFLRAVTRINGGASA